MVKTPSPKPKADSVKVRMYKGLLGDCFLLQTKSAAGASNILIDCGILQGLIGGKEKMKAVAADILKTTGGRLDLLVVTHEHADHISGFDHAADVFFDGKLKIDNLWMAWTEDPADAQAKALHLRFDKTKKAVVGAARIGAALDTPRSPTAGLENFIGPIDAPGLAAAGGGRRTGRQIMDDLKDPKQGSAVRFLTPGEVVATPGPASLRTYVLGPPRKEVRLFKANPSAGDKQETYFGGDGLNHTDQLLGAIDAQTESEPDVPFPKRYRYMRETVEKPETADAGDRAAADWLNHAYFKGPDWRRIDADWLGGAGALALQLDSNTNNTSLVLAFETPAGRVLLFAADAQVGNWLSWYDQTYQDGAAPAISVENILSRVAVYKVGHHASHNATLRDLGLEKMSGQEIVAFIPVVETDARAQASGWNMPYPDLLTRLLAMTDGRVLRGDCKAGLDTAGKALTSDQDFLKRVRDEAAGLYVEYDLPPAQVGSFKKKTSNG